MMHAIPVDVSSATTPSESTISPPPRAHSTLHAPPLFARSRSRSRFAPGWTPALSARTPLREGPITGLPLGQSARSARLAHAPHEGCNVVIPDLAVQPAIVGEGRSPPATVFTPQGLSFEVKQLDSR